MQMKICKNNYIYSKGYIDLFYICAYIDHLKFISVAVYIKKEKYSVD